MSISGYQVLAAAAVAAVLWLLVPPSPCRQERAPRGSPRGWQRLFGRPDAMLHGAPRVAAALGFGAVVLWVLRDRLGVASLPVTGVLVGAVWLALGWLEPARVRRRRFALVLQTPQVLDLLAAALAAGLPLRAATAAVIRACPGAVAEELQRVLNQVSVGIPDSEAWRSLSTHPQLGPAAADLARSVDSGTMLVQALEVHAAAARDDRRGAVEVRARRVGVRSVLPLMLCFLPAFLLLGVIPTLVSAVLRAFHF